MNRSKTMLFVTAAALALGGCSVFMKTSHAPPASPQKYSIEEFLGTTNHWGASFSPSAEKILVSSDESGIYNAYAIQTDGSGTVQLTQSEENSIFAISYFPEDERFLYTSDQGGNELNHVFVQDQTGKTTDLTPGDSLKAIFYGWARDDSTFFIGTNERDRRFFDVYEYDAGTYARSMIYENDDGRDVRKISNNRRYLLLQKVNNNADTDFFLHDRHLNETTLLTDFEGDVRNVGQTFSRDDRYFYYTTDRNSEFRHLVRQHLESRAIERVAQPDWDVWFAYFSKRGKYLIVGTNEDARTKLRMYLTSTMEPAALPAVPDADITSVRISDDETHIAFYASSSRTPRDLFVAKLGDKKARQLTSSLNPNIDPADLTDGQVVRFSSYDGLEIPGVLYRPHVANATNKLPALVWVHGGPGGQSRLGYSALFQYLVNHGYAIYAINNRGSSGYGKTFFHLDDRKHGDADLDDVVESKKMLGETGYVDISRVGVIGASYGGYMTLAALSFRPDAFQVGVDIFGVSNWHRTLQSIPPYWESYRKAMEREFGSFDDEEFLKAKSPLFHANKIRTPLIVLQGANDPRVLKAESDEIVAAVRANGIPVE